MIRLPFDIEFIARALVMAAVVAIAGCDEPPPAPDTVDIEARLGDNLSATRDAAAGRLGATRAANEDAKKRLAPEVGRDAGDAGPE